MARSAHTTRKAVISLLNVVLLAAPLAVAQQSASASLRSINLEPNVLQPSDTGLPPVRPAVATEILASFIKAESHVREALNLRTFKRDVVLQTIGPNGQITGEYIRNSQFLFDDNGNRIERVIYHPPSTIREMRITREDIQDLAGAQLLGIDIAESPNYRLSYTGEETCEGRTVHVVSVQPTIKPSPQRMNQRFFCGSVWIDVQTFQIVKIKGYVEPQGKQRFPLFETWRELVSADLYLPTRTEADEVLHFPHRDVHYRIFVKYHDYKIFGSKLKVTEIDDPTTQLFLQ